MSFSIELPQTYTFSLCIDQGGHTIVDTTVEVPDTREGIARAKRTVQRLMNEYAPTPKAPEPAGLNLESQPPRRPVAGSGDCTHPAPGEKAGRGAGTASPPLPGVREHLRDIPAGVPDRDRVQMRPPHRPHGPTWPVPRHLSVLPA